MALMYLVQHAEKRPDPGDPGLTARGHDQAVHVGKWLHGLGLVAVRCSPQRRARETAAPLAVLTGLPAIPDQRLRERLNWTGAVPRDQFRVEWNHATEVRDYRSAGGESSHDAARRLRTFLVDWPEGHGPVAAVTHGGVTVDLLRSLLGDDALPAGLIADGIPAAAITTVDHLTVRTIASGPSVLTGR